MQPRWKASATVLGRLPLIALAILSLVAGVWGGLMRLPVDLPLPVEHANWITFHGPLMVCGFLGTVIGLERAVGLNQIWPYAAPILTGAGAVTVLSGGLGPTGVALITAGSAFFVGVALQIVKLQRAPFTIVMCLGAFAWLVGNVLWWRGWPFPQLVPWWISFLVLIIVGERLDLSRFQRQERLAQPLLHAALGLFLAGVGLSAMVSTTGKQLAGAGLLALALWLGRFDIARRTVRQSGLTRYMAVCLLMGYVWLAVSGCLLASFASQDTGGRYDAALHAFFLGFVFSMIFGHAPIIFPAVLGRPVAFHGRFYWHFALLHGALLLRVTGDLADWLPGRRWGGMGTAAALALFLANTITALVIAPKTIEHRPPARPSHAG